jgi:glycine/D-amino acid oxidase-like deaminating enzyme
MSKMKVAVIGGSSWGGWIALKLIEAGLDVTVIEARGAGHDLSGSGGHSRIIRATYGGDDTYTQMAGLAFSQWQEYSQKWGLPLIQNTGQLWLFREAPTYARRSLPQMQQYGHVLEEWSIAEVHRRYPAFFLDDIRYAFFEPGAGFIAASNACQQVQQQVIRRGAKWLSLSGKPGTPDKGRLSELLLSNGERVVADWYIFAAGAWNPLLFPELLHNKIYLSRHDVSFFAAGAYQKLPELPIWLDFDSEGILFYGIPHKQPGIKVSFDERSYRLPSADAPREPDAALTERNRQYLARRLPFTRGGSLTTSRVCIYDNSPDGDFILDLHPEADNVLIASGTSGHGYKMGPAIGQMVAEAVTGQTPLPERFSLARFEKNTPLQSQFLPG